MDWEERQQYYDLIEEEIRFVPAKGQKWVLTFEERHPVGHDIVFHAYTEKGETWLLAYEIVDVMELELTERRHKLGETLSGNLRILLSTLRADLPEDFPEIPAGGEGSRFKLQFANRKERPTYVWTFSNGNFKRIRPVLKLIWAVDSWRAGAKAMGWSAIDTKRPTSSPKDRKSSESTPRKSARDHKGRIDPFGQVWKPGD